MNLGRDIPEKYSAYIKGTSVGQPADLVELEAFHYVLGWWENSIRDCVSHSELSEKRKSSNGEWHVNRTTRSDLLNTMVTD